MQDTDIVTLEFTYNDEREGGYTKPSRKAFEQLLRKLLRLPSRCAPRSCTRAVQCAAQPLAVLHDRASGAPFPGTCSAMCPLLCQLPLPPTALQAACPALVKAVGCSPDAPLPTHASASLMPSQLIICRSPALVLLHHYAWGASYGPGHGKGLYFFPPEQELTTFATVSGGWLSMI